MLDNMIQKYEPEMDKQIHELLMGWIAQQNYMLNSLMGQSEHIIYLWGGYPTNKNFNSDIVKKHVCLNCCATKKL